MVLRNLQKTPKMNNVANYSFIVLYFILLLLGLNIPKFSLAVPVFLPIIILSLGYWSIPKSLIRDRMVVLSIFSLILFSIINYSYAYLHGYYSESLFKHILLSPIGFISMFCCGIFLNYKKIPHYPINYILINITLFGGSIVWVFLSIASYHKWNFSLDNILIISREVQSFWKSDISQGINGPSVDMFSYLGLSLSGLFVCNFFSLTRKYEKPLKNIIFITSILLIILSLYSSIALQARTPLIVLLFSSFISYIMSKICFKKSRYKFINTIVYILIFLFLIIWIYEGNSQSNYFLDFNIGNRFYLQGLETPRYEIWLSSIKHIFYYPWGGREFSLPANVNHAHNIWLDQWYDNGFFPMIILLTFHFIQVNIIFSFFRLKTYSIHHIFITCTSIAYFAAFIQAPVLQASPLYFSLSCFFFGSIARLNYEFHKTYESEEILRALNR